ncbi:T6SS effector BTH_I2691 family protein [Pseudomonas ovata]|uniref:T6SS effector BTH_I2691 family protein n=1 Tax=Pseudomonas ovata TaxID=1839709 RepID=UPI000D68B10B|nr:T6SS effector BTH_I2691 family protein [Pseudomonas ovata]
MADKLGTPRQHRATLFDKTPATGTSLCPFKGPHIAIVPVRYALDRSRYDPNPTVFKPLLKGGNWPRLPALKSRRYTLRQLYDGYVYVFDETAGTLHEYTYSATDAGLRRIVWREAQLGQDTRVGSDTDEAQLYLLYPRKHVLHIAYSPLQWTWRTCEHLRSHDGSRAARMKRLDLASYCVTMNEPGTLPLRNIAEAVADIDYYQVNEDLRFYDSAIPSTQPPFNPSSGKAAWVPLGADVCWLGSVPDKDSALLIALDDPLAVLNDLGLQLAADQVAYQDWQGTHEHRSQMATLVTHLCGMPDQPATGLPDAVRGDPVRTHTYLLELEAYLEQYELEERILEENATAAPEIHFVSRARSDALREALFKRYGVTPPARDIESWLQRSKWRREVNLEGARTHLRQQQPAQQRLLQQIKDTLADFERWAVHIGNDPEALFVDIANTDSLHYLMTTLENLLALYPQDLHGSDWLQEQEDTNSSLFGTARYGFSPGLKEALHTQANKLLNGLNDMTNLATRAGELNAVLNHPGFADAPWMKALKQPVQDGFKALRALVSGAGKQAAEGLVMAFAAADSRLATGKQQSLVALIRNLLINLVITNSPGKPEIDANIGHKVQQWKSTLASLERQLTQLKRQWAYPERPYVRRSRMQALRTMNARLRAHEASRPALLDYQNNQYARLLQEDIRAFIQSGKHTLKDWQKHMQAWSKHLGVHGASISWGVIILNFINTAFIWRDLSRDGTLTQKDLAKVAYSLAWSLNLLTALYLESPWSVVRGAKPVVIRGKDISILDHSAAYWRARGNPVWADAVRNFRTRLLGTGLFAIAAAALEIWDLRDDRENAKTDEEKVFTTVKIYSVLAMGSSGALQIAALFNARLATFVMGPWFAFGLMIVGGIYLFMTTLINYLKQDSIGSWLRKCCWSHTPKYRYPDTLEGQIEEKRAFMEIELSPEVLVKSTEHYYDMNIGKGDSIPVAEKNGAWVQIRFPNALRDQVIGFDAIISKRAYGLLGAEKMAFPIKESFLDKGTYRNPAKWGDINNQRPPSEYIIPFGATLDKDDGVIWQTWIPVEPDADFLELQIWYPDNILKAAPQDIGYLYQIALNRKGSRAINGAENTELQVRNETREGAWEIYLIS